MYESPCAFVLLFKRYGSIYVCFFRSEVQLQSVLTFDAISRQRHNMVASPAGAVP